MLNLLIVLITSFTVLTASASESHFGYKKYVEYIPGDIPIIISAPHGGRLTDDSIPDRKKGTLVTDSNTDKLARAVYEAFKGKKPHVIICHLKRIKVDCNRSRQMSCDGNKNALRVWDDYQGFIEKAKKSIKEKNQKVLFIDIHGHGKPFQRLELGYLLSGRQLSKKGDEFNKFEKSSSIGGLQNKVSFEKLIRGPKSLGAFLAQKGYKSVPSPEHKEAEKGKFFSGGYNTKRHGALKSKGCYAIQIEANYKGVRDNKKNIDKFAKSLSSSLLQFYSTYMKE